MAPELTTSRWATDVTGLTHRIKFPDRFAARTRRWSRATSTRWTSSPLKVIKSFLVNRSCFYNYDSAATSNLRSVQMLGKKSNYLQHTALVAGHSISLNDPLSANALKLKQESLLFSSFWRLLVSLIILNIFYHILTLLLMSMYLPLSTAGDPPTPLATVACSSYCLMISRALSHDEKYVQVFFRWRKHVANMNVVYICQRNICSNYVAKACNYF